MKTAASSSTPPKWPWIGLAAGFGVTASGEAPPLDAERAARVDRLWQQACAERPSMFDGRIFVLDRIDANGAQGRWTGYRRAHAQLREPSLFDPPLRALAVNGVVVTADDHVLVARRHPRAIYLPGRWQTPPAGSVEDRGDEPAGTIRLDAQLAAEAEEELGIEPHELRPARPILAIEHPTTHVVDVGLLARTVCTAAELRQRFTRLADPEYDALETVALGSLQERLAHEPSWLPTARLLLQHLVAECRAGRTP